VTEEFDEDTIDYRFRVRVLIRHYSLPAAAITAALGIEPMAFRSIGQRGVLPNGRVLEKPSSLTARTAWRDYEGDRVFYPSGIAFPNEIVGANDDFIRELTETGGEVALVFDLPGDVNVGSALDAAGVARLAELRMELSTEVFPSFALGARGQARAASTA
jgi:hypothetical protein